MVNSSSAPAILCAGIAVQDIVFRVEQFPQPGGKCMTNEFIVVSGGCAVNAAIAVARLGGPELVSTADIAQNAANTTAWFVAFAPASKPRVAVAVMLPNAGQGGASAAPIAKRVLQAAL